MLLAHKSVYLPSYACKRGKQYKFPRPLPSLDHGRRLEGKVGNHSPTCGIEGRPRKYRPVSGPTLSRTCPGRKYSQLTYGGSRDSPSSNLLKLVSRWRYSLPLCRRGHLGQPWRTLHRLHKCPRSGDTLAYQADIIVIYRLDHQARP